MTRKIHDKDGPIVPVRVTKPDGKGRKHDTQAKVDTGATMTCVPESLFENWRLTPIDSVTLLPFDVSTIPMKASMTSEPTENAGGHSRSKSRLTERNELGLGRHTYLAYDVILKVEGFAHPMPLKVAAIPGRKIILLGRDFLKHAELHYYGAMGQFELIEV